MKRIVHSEEMTSVMENNNRPPASKKHLVKPLLLAQNSFHVPSHVLLPRGSLFAHPFPESVHPFETHEQLAISELTAKTNAGGNHLRLDTKTSRRAQEMSKHGGQNVHKIHGPRGDRKSGGFAVKNIPVLPFKVAVLCLILNIMMPGAGKLIKYARFVLFKTDKVD